MSKLVLNNITSGFASTTATNANNDLVEAAIENTLSRDGTSPNQMMANLDMNGYAILNQRATSGNENFIWMETWITGEEYSVNNLVYAPEGTNEGSTLICVTANTAGATLDGDAAKWAVFSQRGASGAGTGDVVGPASSTADSLAKFSGTTGKLLKNGAVIGVDVQAYSTKLASIATNTLTAANKIPYSTALNTASELTLDTDGTLAANSDTTIATQKAVKTYVDTSIVSQIKAWANFNGTTVGTNAPTAGSNITSVTRNSTGDYTINFTTALSSANYAVVAMGRATTTAYGQSWSTNISQTTAPSTSAVRIVNSYQDDNSNSVAYVDSSYMCIVVLGE